MKYNILFVKNNNKTLIMTRRSLFAIGEVREIIFWKRAVR